MITTIYSFGAKTGSAPGRQIDGSSTYRWASKFDTGGKQVTVQSLHARFLAPSSAKVRLALYRSAGNWPGELIDVTQEKVGVPAGNVEFLFDKWGSNPLSGGGWLLQGTFWLAVIADGPVLIGTEPIQSGTQNQLQTVYGTSQYSWGADPFGSGSPDSVTGFDAVRIAVSAWAWAPYVSPPMPSADQADFAAAVAPISVEAGAGSSSNITVSQYNGF